MSFIKIYNLSIDLSIYHIICFYLLLVVCACNICVCPSLVRDPYSVALSEVCYIFPLLEGFFYTSFSLLLLHSRVWGQRLLHTVQIVKPIEALLFLILGYCIEYDITVQ